MRTLALFEEQQSCRAWNQAGEKRAFSSKDDADEIQTGLTKIKNAIKNGWKNLPPA